MKKYFIVLGLLGSLSVSAGTVLHIYDSQDPASTENSNYTEDKASNNQNTYSSFKTEPVSKNYEARQIEPEPVKSRSYASESDDSFVAPEPKRKRRSVKRAFKKRLAKKDKYHEKTFEDDEDVKNEKRSLQEKYGDYEDEILTVISELEDI